MHSIFGLHSNNAPFIIADLGLTCGGSLSRSLELIATAKKLGVDAVKFQMLDSAELLGDRTVEYSYPTMSSGEKTENMYEMFLGLEMSDAEWQQIRDFCNDLSMGLIVTCHVESAIDRVNKLGLAVNKICTWSLSHFRMISELGKNGKPLILDTGTITIDELKEIEELYKSAGGGEIIVLYDFHTGNPCEMNFKSIQQLLNAGYKVGYTPQGRRDWLDYMSIGVGAQFLEKRLTLSRDTPENGHWKAHEPDEFKVWMDNVRECYLALGDGELKPTVQDLKDAKKYYKSAYLNQDVTAGELIREDLFDYKRPGLGVSSRDIRAYFIGNKFDRSYRKGELFIGHSLLEKEQG
jgi:N-acetylneuraminate synthase/N,N'-diacetyllegionaminate synthase